MAMKYEDALKAWGYAILVAKREGESRWYGRAYPPVDRDLVRVEMDFDEGFSCCGGTDPNCYCSYAQSPTANVVITDGRYRKEIPADEFDFATVLGEIVAAGGGAVTA